MLKTIIKEAKEKKITPLQPQKQLETMPMYRKTKPTIYQRVDREKRRQKAIQIIMFKSEYFLKRKHFKQLKFYHNIIQLRRRIKLSSKYIGFCIIKDNYFNKKEKYDFIINHFIKLQKIKVLSLFYKEYILNFKKNNILRESLISNFHHFITITKNNISSNYNSFNTIRLFYFRMLINKIFIKNYTQTCVNKNLITYKKMIRKRYQKKILQRIKKYIRIKYQTNLLRKIRAYDNFISQFKHHIQKKRVLNHATKYYFIKSIYSKLLLFSNNLHISESKNSIAQMFYEEKLKKKCINILRLKTELIKAFKNLVVKYGRYSKFLIKGKISQEKKKIGSLLKKYSKYKRQKLIDQKVHFFKVIDKMTNQKKKKFIISQFIFRKTQKNAWNILYNHWYHRKQFHIFLNTFKSIMNNIIRQNALHLMQYKVHRFNSQGKLPKIVSYYIQNKLEVKIFKLQYNQMKKFYKKAKRFIFNKKILQKKMHLAAYFDSKKKKVKCYESFKRLLIYVFCRKKVQSYTQAKLCHLIEKLPLKIHKTMSVQKSYHNYLYYSWMEKVIFAYTIINIDNIPFHKKIHLNWLIKLNQKKRRNTTLLSICYFAKIFYLILIKSVKRKMIQTILYDDHKKLLIKNYINKLIKAKKSSLELKNKFMTIKNECMNNLNTSN